MIPLKRSSGRLPVMAFSPHISLIFTRFADCPRVPTSSASHHLDNDVHARPRRESQCDDRHHQLPHTRRSRRMQVLSSTPHNEAQRSSEQELPFRCHQVPPRRTRPWWHIRELGEDLRTRLRDTVQRRLLDPRSTRSQGGHGFFFKGYHDISSIQIVQSPF